MIDLYEHRLSRLVPTSAIIRLTPLFVLFVLVDVIARATRAAYAVHVAIAPCAIPLGILLWRAHLRTPTHLRLSAEGLSLEGRSGRVLLQPSDLALWTRGGFGLTLRTQRRLVPALAIWHDRDQRDAVIERFRSAGAEIR